MKLTQHSHIYCTVSRRVYLLTYLPHIDVDSNPDGISARGDYECLTCSTELYRTRDAHPAREKFALFQKNTYWIEMEVEEVGKTKDAINNNNEQACDKVSVYRLPFPGRATISAARNGENKYDRR